MGYYLLLLYWSLRGALFLSKGCFALRSDLLLTLLRCPKFLRCLTADISLFVSDGPISFNSERNGGKNAGKNCVFAFPQRAMGCGNLMLPAARSRKSSFFVPSKDCLSNSAAAADWSTEQRFWFYRCSA